MRRPRWQKIISDLFGNRTRSILVVSSIAVGLFALGVIATIYIVIQQDMKAGYAAVNAANISVQTGLISQDVVDHIGRMEGVREVEGIRAVSLRVKNREGKWETLELRHAAHLSDMRMNRIQPLRGEAVPQDDEIIVDQNRFAGLGAALGEWIEVEAPSGLVRYLRVVGVYQDLTIGAFSGGGGFFNAPTQGYVTENTLAKMEQDSPEEFSGVYATIEGDRGDSRLAEQVSGRISAELERVGVDVRSVTVRSAFDHPNDYLIDAIAGVLLVLGLLVVFLGGFLVTNTLQALVNQQVQQIGIMKTLGARRYQIVFVYMLLILVYGMFAFAIAMPLANRVSFLLLSFLAGELNFVLLGDRLIWPVVAAQAFLALVMPQLAALVPILQGTKISVQEAITGISQGGGEGEAAVNRKPRARLPGRWRAISRPMLISFRNTFRRKGRLALTLTTLILGGAIFIATFNVQISMSRYTDQIAQYFLADVNVSLDRPYRNAEIDRMLAGVPGVGRVEGWASALTELIQADGTSGERVALLAPPAGSTLVKSKMLQGRWISPRDQNAIVLNELFLTRFPGIRLGDTVELHVNGRDTAWVVVGFFQFAGNNGGLTAYTSYEYLSGLIGQNDQAVTFRIVGDHANMTSAEQDRLARAVEARLARENIRITDLETGSALTGIMGGGFAALTAFLLFLAALTALVGSIGLAGTMSMNVLERTREIGVMRAIGASDRTLMRMVLVEGLVIGLISYLVGSLLAFPISKILADGISYSVFNAPSSFGFTPLGFGIWLAAVLVLSILASVVPARSAVRLTIREVLAYE